MIAPGEGLPNLPGLPGLGGPVLTSPITFQEFTGNRVVRFVCLLAVLGALTRYSPVYGTISAAICLIVGLGYMQRKGLIT